MRAGHPRSPGSAFVVLEFDLHPRFGLEAFLGQPHLCRRLGRVVRLQGFVLRFFLVVHILIHWFSIPGLQCSQNREVTSGPPLVGGFDPLEYWEQRLRRYFGPCGVGCLGLSEGYNRWLARVRAVVGRRALVSVCSDWRGRHVLDIGSGTGFWIDQWRRLGAEPVIGSDFTSGSVARLRELWGRTAIHRIDITAHDLPSMGPFDAVSAFDVFFHIVDDAAYARAWRNVAWLVRPGGLFFLTENFLRNGPERQKHLVSRTLRDIERLVAAAGFEILARRPVFVLMNRPIDSASPTLRWWWQMLERIVSYELAGSLVGAGLFPIEVLLTSILRQGPSTELMICRKREGAGLTRT